MNVCRSSVGCLFLGLAAAVAVAPGLWTPGAAVAAEAPASAEPAADPRWDKLKDLNGYFPFQPPASREAWQARAERLRRQILVATGLWPMPSPTPAEAVVHGKVQREGYTVERVYFQSYPGHFVTGSLYRPAGRSGRLPGVLCPHGHWPDGRFFDHGEKKVLQEIVQGAERFRVSGRYPLQARCVQLARMGCVVFHYDMVGYADSRQLEHRAGSRPAMNTPENWGFFSPQAEARLQTVMGLQTYNSVRALDWFSRLPDVDPQRIGVTGASGGGTQTFVLCAVDPRPAVAFPAVMVSTAMQGGCTCENACYLRRESGNIEIAALTAPRPLGMTAADDWTREIATKGLPELQSLYKLLGVPQNVMARPLLHFPHNYNQPSRAAMYGWMNKHLKLGLAEPIVEDDFVPLSREELTVWNASHPPPPAGDDYERSLLRWMTEDHHRQMQALVPRDAAGVREFCRVVGGAWDVLIGRGLPAAGEVQPLAEPSGPSSAEGPRTVTLRHRPSGEQAAIDLYGPAATGKPVVIVVDRQGKDAVRKNAGLQSRLARAGVTLVAVDLFGQGRPLTHNRLNTSGRDRWATYAGYTYGYNHSLFAQRVHDLLLAVSYARHHLQAPRVDVVGLRGAGAWVAAARAQAGTAIDRAAVDTAGFRFASLSAIDDAEFVPGAAKYLDLPGLLALSAPGALWLAGEGEKTPAIVEAVYRAAGQAERAVAYGGTPADQEKAAFDWLLR